MKNFTNPKDTRTPFPPPVITLHTTPLSLSMANLGHINSSIYGSFRIYICSPMVNSLTSINNQLVGSNPTTMKCNYQLKVCNKKLSIIPDTR